LIKCVLSGRIIKLLSPLVMCAKRFMILSFIKLLIFSKYDSSKLHYVPTCRSQDNNEWICTSTPPTGLHVIGRENFVFYQSTVFWCSSDVGFDDTCLQDTRIKHKIYVPLIGPYLFLLEFPVETSEAVISNLKK
jgi:hypothetical protein